VIDSIQTAHRSGVSSSPGSIGQVRECGAELLRVAKSDGVAVIVIGHVTKEGFLAGPRTLEHMVDTVLYVEGDRYHGYRILRAAKNRFGSTNEIGVFEMSESGLQEIPDPSQLFLSERVRGTPGSVVGCAMEGTRPLLVETQALVSPTCYGVPQRVATGVDRRRLAMLLAVLERRVGMRLSDSDVFVNVAGGLKISEPALDLSVVLAVASSVKNLAYDSDTLVVGEVGLGGEVRGVSQAARRVAEGEKLGFCRCLISNANLKSLCGAGSMVVRGVRDVAEALDIIGSSSG
jgi:DNA repair protein RadA/Sms